MHIDFFLAAEEVDDSSTETFRNSGLLASCRHDGKIKLSFDSI